MANLTPELEEQRIKIKKLAEEAGLDFYETIFELVTYKEMNTLAAYGGFPVRYPHWKFGMDYEKLSKGYEYGLSKIYEMVINTDPCYSYLMEGNMIMDQKLVMAHVYGHADFFKNNKWFAPTNRKMMDAMANHAVRIRRHIDKHGQDTVESFIDRCLSLENLIDRYSSYSKKTNPSNNQPKSQPSNQSSNDKTRSKKNGGEQEPNYILHVERDYMKNYINPPEFIQEQQRKAEEQEAKQRRFPQKPEKDILKFLIDYAPLLPWQKDVLAIIRDESYYFAPQGMTKTMNEGWASYWHTRLMTENILCDSEIIDYADHHSGTVAMAPNGYNPYKVGIELFRDIKNRWDRGQFGPEWENIEDFKTKKNWNKKTDQGLEKIFQVRRDYNDVTFIDEFLTEEFCVDHKLFVYKYDEQNQKFVIDTRNFKAIKAQLLFQMTNFGQPIIRIEDANFENRGELLLTHLHEGVDLQPNYLQETLKNVQILWQRPVNLVTGMDGKGYLFRYDGQEFQSHQIKQEEPNKETDKETSSGD